MGLTLDESAEDEDEVIETEGITFVIERSLHERLGDVAVEYAPESGVVVTGTGLSERSACKA